MRFKNDLEIVMEFAKKIGVFGEFLEFWRVFGVVWGVFGEVLSRRKF